MGSREESAPNKNTSKVVSSSVAASPATQEVPSTPSMYPDWQSMAAYYGSAAAAGTPPAFFSPPSPSPYMWGGQHLMSPYGTPVPYHMFTPGIYHHPSMATGTTVPPVEVEGRYEGKGPNSAKKCKGSLGSASQVLTKSGDGVKAISSSANDDSSQSDGSGSEGSSNAGDEETHKQSTLTAGKRTYDKMNPEVSLAGKLVVTTPPTSLNIGMDLWNGAHAGSFAMKDRTATTNVVSPIAPPVVIGNQWIQDERELKRQKRKESNRESARRSRLRKQQECEELATKVEELTAENNRLRNEIDQFKEQCKALQSENASIREELDQTNGPEVLSATEGNNNSSISQSVDNEVDYNTRSTQSNGNFLTSNGNREPSH